VALVTFTVITHDALAGTVAPASVRLVPLLLAVTVAAPAQVVAAAALAVFASPAG
jgi:hypothetical protein